MKTPRTTPASTPGGSPMKWLRLLLSFRLFLLIALVFLTWQIWSFSRPRPRPLTLAETSAVEKACAQTVAQIGQASPPPARIGVATLIGDDTGQVTVTLKRQLAAVSGYTVLTESPIRRFLADVSEAVANATNPEEIIRAGQSASMDVVVAGRVLAIEQTNDVGRISLQAFAYDVRPGKLVVSETLNVQCAPAWSDKAAAQIEGTSPLLRWAIWLALAGILPWIASVGVAWAMDKKSNAASLALILTLVVADMALFVLLFRPELDGPRPILQLLLALAIGAAYTLWACETIAARRKA